MKPGRYAAIDIGTVTCRLLLADVSEAGIITPVEKGYRITNLGEDVDATGVLKPAAMERVRAAVADFQASIQRNLVDGCPVNPVVMATSASRDAKNADEFQDILAAQGVTLTVIPGQREASLTFRGACSDYPNEQVIVVDIGGGSTEVVAGRSGEDPTRAHSFNIGCRRVTERFLHDDPPTPEQLAQAHTWVASEMSPYFAELQKRGLLSGRIIAVAGTATSVVSMDKHMEVYDSSRVHGTVVERHVLDALAERLARMTLVQRQQVVGLDPGRAPVIVAGLLILQEIMNLSGLDVFTVSESDILQGILLDAAQGT